MIILVSILFMIISIVRVILIYSSMTPNILNIISTSTSMIIIPVCHYFIDVNEFNWLFNFCMIAFLGLVLEVITIQM